MSKPKKSKSFKYNLESVLKVRKIRQDQQYEQFVEAQRRLEIEEKKEAEIKQFQAEKYSELRTLMSPGTPISNFHEVLMRKSHLDIVKTQVEAQEKEKHQALEAQEQERQNLVRAMQDKQIIEKDKSNKKTAWTKLMEKEQNKFIDDIATIAFTRKAQNR